MESAISYTRRVKRSVVGSKYPEGTVAAFGAGSTGRGSVKPAWRAEAAGARWCWRRVAGCGKARAWSASSAAIRSSASEIKASSRPARGPWRPVGVREGRVASGRLGACRTPISRLDFSQSVTARPTAITTIATTVPVSRLLLPVEGRSAGCGRWWAVGVRLGMAGAGAGVYRPRHGEPTSAACSELPGMGVGRCLRHDLRLRGCMNRGAPRRVACGIGTIWRWA